ncbi:P-II family nitrogen regulator [Gloeobacter violaceus]|uniref:Nitrogen regulatory protein P-II n=1 Tax=Gloeobacter violaceus (strain ATCC 29082 / PCC 7421) TaxID=251221 RepID=Q7NMS6_GLOVI|nr:P-II family nitrogen regulator [Gloeobacter violaceus]BAC88630.1 nitrogen regulatory protein P-II [Gloeobacter violaceus PCC 7421]
MNKIEAIIQPSRLDAVEQALAAIGVQGMTVSRVEGFGRQRGHSVIFRGFGSAAQFLAKLKLEIVVPDEFTETVVERIVQAARTGSVGDGKIFVLPVTQAVRVRTGECDLEAVRFESPAVLIH